MTQPTELQLIERITQGDQDALVALHERYVNAVYAVAYRVLNDRMAAEEVTQDTFMSLWTKAAQFDPAKGRFITWLLTVARRRAIDVYRKRKRREPQTGLFSIDEHPHLWEQLTDDEGQRGLRHSLQSVLASLPEEQAQVIELAYFYGMTHNDIAVYLGQPLGTVKTRIRLGMQKLRQVWQQAAESSAAGRYQSDE